MHLCQVSRELAQVWRQWGEAGGHVFHRAVQQGLDHLALKRGQIVVHDALQRTRLVKKAGDFFSQFLLGLVNAGALLLGQGPGLAFGVGLALGTEQGEHQMTVFPVEREAARLGKGIQRCVGFGFLGLVGRFNVLALGLEIRAIQALGNVFLDVLAPLHHALAQQSPLPWRQSQRLGLLGGIEVVQVTQVGRYGPCGGQLQHELI